MDTELMLQIVHRAVDADSKALLTQSIAQLNLVTVAADDFADAVQHAPGQSSNDTQTGIQSAAKLDAGAEALIMQAIAARSATKAMAAMKKHLLDPDTRANLRARSFIYELALFIKLLEQIAAGRPDLAAALSPSITALKAAAPGAIDLRELLAHFDERTLGRAYKKTISPVPHKTGGEIIGLGLHREGKTFGGHTANGSFVGITIDGAVVSACRAALVGMLQAYPEGPDLKQTMANYRASMAT